MHIAMDQVGDALLRVAVRDNSGSGFWFQLSIFIGDADNISVT